MGLQNEFTNSSAGKGIATTILAALASLFGRCPLIETCTTKAILTKAAAAVTKGGAAATEAEAMRPEDSRVEISHLANHLAHVPDAVQRHKSKDGCTHNFLCAFRSYHGIIIPVH